MDSIDLKIIALLMKDAQMPFNKIAQQLGIGTDTAIRRYRKLVKEGVIHYPSIIVNLKKAGYNGHACISLSISASADASRLYDQLSQLTNVLTVVYTIGDYDFWLHCIFSDLDDLIRLNKEICKIEGIKLISEVYLPTDTFLPTLPTLEYYSKAISGSPKKSK
jgi:Lrp/AsnC family transcriptional regulator, regulator for asnA, asnC and gidA